MTKIKTQEDIHAFVYKLLSANIELPINVDIKIELSKKEFNNIIPFDFMNCDYIEYNGAGMKVILTTKNK